MSDNLAMAAQLAGQSLRFGWYFALNRALDWRTGQLAREGDAPRYRPVRPVPSLQELIRIAGSKKEITRAMARPAAAILE